MQEPFSGYTGRGVRIGIIDSGVNPAHPHVSGVAGGVCIDPVENERDYLDYNGHGTAVTAAIREKAPDALVYAIKVFGRALTARIETIIRAIEWAIDSNMALINLSLGTVNTSHREPLKRALKAAAEKNVVVISANRASGEVLLPGSLPLAIGVEADWECPRDQYRTEWIDGQAVFLASAYPREIPGVSKDRNLHGISFAVANMAGFVARAREMQPRCSITSLIELMRENASS